MEKNKNTQKNRRRTRTVMFVKDLNEDIIEKIENKCLNLDTLQFYLNPQGLNVRLFYKDGELIKTIDGVLKTFDWAKENNIAHQDWVKRSLRTGEETESGWKYKEGGYLFKYAD